MTESDTLALVAIAVASGLTVTDAYVVVDRTLTDKDGASLRELAEAVEATAKGEAWAVS